MSKLTDFYCGEDTDCEGRLLEEMLQWSYKQIEYSHDSIQWFFPLKEPSNFNPDAPLLTDEDIQQWHANPILDENMLRAFRLFLDFLGLDFTGSEVVKAPHFEKECRGLFTHANHNWLRITRVIKCLKTIGTPMLVDAANALYSCLKKLHEEEGLVSENSFAYWTEAWSTITNSQSPPSEITST